MPDLFFDGWAPILRTLVAGVLGYIALVMLLRVSGKRTLSKMSAFDFVVTVALGSTFATVLLSSEVSLLRGIVAMALLVGLQFTITWLAVRVGWWRKFVTGEPRLLLYDGAFIATAMKATRVTEDDVLAAVRLAGHADRRVIRAVILETDASFSVIAQDERGPTPSMPVIEGVRPA